MLPVAVNVPVAGSYSSALANQTAGAEVPRDEHLALFSNVAV